MASKDPAERRRIARLGGKAARARGIDTTAARAGRWAKYLKAADDLARGRPQDPEHRDDLARELRDRDMAAMSRLGVQARARKREERRRALIAEARAAAAAELARRGRVARHHPDGGAS